MSQLRPFRFPRALGALTLVTSLATALNAHAAELGEPVLRSHIGHNLIADIELTGIADAAIPVQVRMASPDVYRGANIAMPAILSSLQLSVMRRDGRQFLHVISTRPVNVDHVNLFLELNDGARRHVRAVTLWLTPDPRPAPPPVPLPVPQLVTAPVPQPAAVAAPAPAKAAAAPAPRVARAPEPLLPRLRAAAPAACPQVDAEQLRTCAALDYKNGMLQARIVELEEKVKALQLAFDGRGEPAAPAAQLLTKPVKPAVLIKPKKKVERFPWLLVLAGLAGVAVIGALVVFLRRKKAQLKGIPPTLPKPGLLSKLKARFKRKPKAAAAPSAPLEPTVE